MNHKYVYKTITGVIDVNKESCPVCNHTLADGETCTRCGYDRSCDYEQYPTPCRIPTKTPSYANLRARWEQEQARIQSAMEDKTRADRLMKELSQEKARCSAAERQQKELSEKYEALSQKCSGQEAAIAQLKQKIAQLENERNQLMRALKQNRSHGVPANSNTTMLPAELKEAYRAGKSALNQGNYQEAAKWYRIAAKQGYPPAQNELGFCCFYGFGVSKNQAEAAKWYRKAAEQGHAEAQCNLGDCYYYGQGVVKNKVEAAKWYRKAAEQGNADAKQALKRMNCE